MRQILIVSIFIFLNSFFLYATTPQEAYNLGYSQGGGDGSRSGSEVGTQ